MPKQLAEKKMDLDLDLNHAAFQYFDGLGFYNFCLSRFRLDWV